MQQQLGVLGTISAFPYRHRETKKNMCRDGRSQDLLDTDLQPAIRQLKYVRQQYTHSNTMHMSKQRYTQGNNTIHKRPTAVSSSAHKKSNTMGRKYSTQFLMLLLHRYSTPILTGRSLHFTNHKYLSQYAPIYPPSLHFTSLH